MPEVHFLCYRFIPHDQTFKIGAPFITQMKKKMGSKRISCLLESPVELNTERKPKAQFLFQFSSVTQLCPTLFNPMDCSIPGFPIHHQLLELAHTHSHQVGDAIQSSYPLSSPSPPAFNLSQHQDLFQCLGVKLSVRI